MALEIEPQEQEILNSVDIPPRPKALLTVSEEAKKDEPNFPTIAHAIADDVSISSAVLRVVNSPAFRRVNAIGSIDQALNMLGFKRVLSIVNAVAVRSASKTNVDLEEFWTFASSVAHACVIITKALKRPQLGDDAYTLGLFHTAGVPIMMSRFAEYTDFFTSAEQEGWTLSINREKEEFNTTHTSIGALMAQEWSLPECIVDAIYNLHYADGIFESDDMDETTLQLIAVLKMARDICHEYLQSNCGSDEWNQVEGQVLDYLGVDEDKWLDIREKVISGLDEEE